jgi:hypothetical protein
MPQGGTGFIEIPEPEKPLGVETFTNPSKGTEYILETCDAGKPLFLNLILDFHHMFPGFRCTRPHPRLGFAQIRTKYVLEYSLCIHLSYDRRCPQCGLLG